MIGKLVVKEFFLLFPDIVHGEHAHSPSPAIES